MGGLVFVALAVVLFSTSPVLIRLAAPLTPLEITFGRMAVAALTVLLIGRLAKVDLIFSWDDLRKFLGYGLITALHFLFYIASLSFTSIAHSLTLVYTAPIFVTVFSSLFLKEPIPRAKYLGVGLAVVGTAILAGFEPAMSPQMLVGDLLALGSAITFGLYSVAGRFERSNYPLLKYALAVYSAAALWSLPAALAVRSPQQPWPSLLAVVALGVFPLAIGHTLYNASLRRVHATYVNLVSTQEVTGGVALGYLLLGEVPSAASLLGATITLAGVGLVLTLQGKVAAPSTNR